MDGSKQQDAANIFKLRLKIKRNNTVKTFRAV
jgi:hypothetical protein